MERDNGVFMERTSHDLEARRIACKVLGVQDTADREELKKAYRRAAMKFHPDKDMDDPSANRRFALVKCAYKLLAEDKSCEALFAEIDSWSGVPEDDKYKLDNLWGHFLWWREKFF